MRFGCVGTPEEAALLGDHICNPLIINSCVSVVRNSSRVLSQQLGRNTTLRASTGILQWLQWFSTKADRTDGEGKRERWAEEERAGGPWWEEKAEKGGEEGRGEALAQTGMATEGSGSWIKCIPLMLLSGLGFDKHQQAHPYS